MILGYNEAQEVNGRFYEFEYSIKVIRDGMSKNFECFKDNNKTEVVLLRKIYCRRFEDVVHAISEWNRMAKGLCNIYEYNLIGQKSTDSYTASEVVDKIYKENNFKYLAHLSQIGGTDFIM